jgi:hypothetical protein
MGTSRPGQARMVSANVVLRSRRPVVCDGLPIGGGQPSAERGRAVVLIAASGNRRTYQPDTSR